MKLAEILIWSKYGGDILELGQVETQCQGSEGNGQPYWIFCLLKPDIYELYLIEISL